MCLSNKLNSNNSRGNLFLFVWDLFLFVWDLFLLVCDLFLHVYIYMRPTAWRAFTGGTKNNLSSMLFVACRSVTFIIEEPYVDYSK